MRTRKERPSLCARTRLLRVTFLVAGAMLAMLSLLVVIEPVQAVNSARVESSDVWPQRPTSAVDSLVALPAEPETTDQTLAGERPPVRTAYTTDALRMSPATGMEPRPTPGHRIVSDEQSAGDRSRQTAARLNEIAAAVDAETQALTETAFEEIPVRPPLGNPAGENPPQLPGGYLVSYDPATGRETWYESVDAVRMAGQAHGAVAAWLPEGVPLVDDPEWDPGRGFTGLDLVADTTAWPYRATCKIFLHISDGQAKEATGVLIDAKTILTAGHVVNAPGGLSWSTIDRVIPAYNNGATPFTETGAYQLYSWTAWTDGDDYDHDMGVIVLHEPLGALTGWLGYGSNADCGFFTGDTFYSPGYPYVDAPYNGCCMYERYGSFDWCDERLCFSNDPFHGLSGSGARHSNDVVYAINASGGIGYGSCYTWLTSSKFTDIGDIIAAHTPSSVDLIPLDTDIAPGVVAAGDTLDSMSFVAHNYSSASWSGTVSFDIRLSYNDVISDVDLLLSSRSFTYDFGPKNGVRVDVYPPSIPASVAVGDYYVGVILNIADHDMGNNATNFAQAAPLTVICPTPALPTGVAASDGTYTDRIHVSWNPVLDAYGYEVWRNSADDTSTAVFLGWTPGTVIDDVSAAPDTTYWYWVRTSNECGSVSVFSTPDTGWRTACVACPPEAIDEGEPDCHEDYVDVTNGGCNSDPPVFSPIACGQTICGTAGTYLSGGETYRDTDWFEVTLDELTLVTWSVTADFPVVAGIVDNGGVADCNDVSAFLVYDSAGTCQEAAVTYALPPGTWWLWVGPEPYADVPCGSSYVAALSCAECTVACPPGALDEGEPACYDDYVDMVNGGCNSAPPVFTSLPLGTTVCGTSGIFTCGESQCRDTDWYQITTTELSLVTWTVEASFPVVAGIVNNSGVADCGVVDGFLTSAVGPACEPTEVSVTLPAGTWWLWVGPDWEASVACGAAYVATATSEPCDVTCPPESTPEGEPNCYDNYVDQTNGGCNVDPPVFGSIGCGETICGTAGTYLVEDPNSPGTYLDRRDTDWYALDLVEPTEITYTVEAEFPVLMGIIGNGGIANCENYAGWLEYRTSSGCTPAVIRRVLPPGTWWLYVAPSSFSGVACGSLYIAGVSCLPSQDCNHNAIRDECDVSCAGDCADNPDCGQSADCQPDGVPDECQLGSMRYLLDDGVAHSDLGFGATTDIVCLVQHFVEPDAPGITSVSVSWGSVAANTPVTLFVWSDPDQDGMPHDAAVLAQTQGVVSQPDRNAFSTYSFYPPVDPGPAGTSFFIGYMIQTDEYPIAIDETAPAMGRNWLLGDGNLMVDPADLGNPGYTLPLTLLEDVGFPSNLLVRATDGSHDCNLNGVPDNCEGDPYAVFVDAAFAGPCEFGTAEAPFNTVNEGNDAAAAGGALIIIQGGLYPESVTFTKSLRLESGGGLVRIEP